MIADSTLQRVADSKCLDDLARLIQRLDSFGLSREGTDSDVIEIMDSIQEGRYFPFAGFRADINKWARQNRHHIDEQLPDECLDYIVLFETAVLVWEPSDYPALFFHVAARILDRLPEPMPDVPKVALFRKLRRVIREWRSLGL